MLEIKFNNEIIYVDPEDNTNVSAAQYTRYGNMLAMRNALPASADNSWESIAKFLMSNEGKEAIVEAMLIG